MKAINDLLSIMKRLRDPDTGCPWDRKQTIESIAPYTLEEVYEVLECLEKEDMDGLCKELGDLLFHIVFYAEMASENSYFDFQQVVEQVAAKLQRRHPHVFADQEAGSGTELSRKWETMKQQERQEKALRTGTRSRHLDDIGANMPAIIRAAKLQKRAAGAGFDWSAPEPVMAKIEEELLELKTEFYGSAKQEKLSEELGDLLFSCVNLARHIEVDADMALRRANRKFESRFRFVEEQLALQGFSLEQASLQQMEKLWQAAKTIGYITYLM
jgi:nucleoside triphosphate diphosphatase